MLENQRNSILQRPPIGKWGREIPTLLIFLIISLVYFYSLGSWLANDDEGTFLYQSWRVLEGDQLYADVYSSRWPLFIYTGAFWLRLFGHSVVPLRIISILLILGTATLVYLIVLRYATRFEALTAVIGFLVNPLIFDNARFFTTEPYYIAISLLGFYLFLRTYNSPKRWHLLLPAALFPIAAQYKVLAHLIAAGCLIFLGTEWLANWKNRSVRQDLFKRILIFGVAHSLIYIFTVLVVMVFFPTFTQGVLGANFAAQPATQFSFLGNLRQLTITFIRYFLENIPLIAIALVGIRRSLAKNREVRAIAWQIPTILAFILLSRSLFSRLFIYTNPFWAILFGLSLGNLRDQKGFNTFYAIFMALFIGWNAVLWPMNLYKNDHMNRDVAAILEQVSQPDDLVVADYQTFNFYAQREATFQASEISMVIIQNGRLSAQSITSELEQSGANFFVIDRNGEHLALAADIAVLDQYLDRYFELTHELEGIHKNEASGGIEVWSRKQ